MTSLMIGYPDIPMRATGIKSWATNASTETPNEGDDYQAVNAYEGDRTAYWKSSYSKSEHNLRFDLGPSGDRSASFLILSGLDALQALYPTTTTQFELMRSVDDSSYTAEQTISNLHSLSLVGPNTADYITTFTASSAYRYWKARISSTAGTADFTSLIGKVYFGHLFDMGVEPATYSIERAIVPAEFYAASGSRFSGKLNLPKYKISLEWEGVDDSVIKLFFDEIYSKRNTHTFFLYTSSYHDILDDKRLIHVALEDARTRDPHNISNFNTLTADFIEVLG